MSKQGEGNEGKGVAPQERKVGLGGSGMHVPCGTTTGLTPSTILKGKGILVSQKGDKGRLASEGVNISSMI